MITPFHELSVQEKQNCLDHFGRLKKNWWDVINLIYGTPPPGSRNKSRINQDQMAVFESIANEYYYEYNVWMTYISGGLYPPRSITAPGS